MTTLHSHTISPVLSATELVTLASILQHWLTRSVVTLSIVLTNGTDGDAIYGTDQHCLQYHRMGLMVMLSMVLTNTVYSTDRLGRWWRGLCSRPAPYGCRTSLQPRRCWREGSCTAACTWVL